MSLLLHDPMYQMLALILDLVLLMAVYVFTYPKYNANQVMPAFFAIVYVGVMLSYVYQTRMLDGGKFHVWLIFPVLLGLRYVCILCRRTLWKT